MIAQRALHTPVLTPNPRAACGPRGSRCVVPLWRVRGVSPAYNDEGTRGRGVRGRAQGMGREEQALVCACGGGG